MKNVTQRLQKQNVAVEVIVSTILISERRERRVKARVTLERSNSVSTKAWSIKRI